MDPNANLQEQRRLVARMLRNEGSAATHDVLRLAELVFALDEWISQGGALPHSWGRK